jgi:polyferredoxin
MTKTIPIAVNSNPDNDGRMYISERKIYPREVEGRFQRLRTAAVFWLLGMYYVFPWLNWDGRQAVLFDLPARRFYVFGLNFWPQDFIFLALLLILAGLALFFFTALAGRLWCGYACPQTVWTEVFLWMERWTEGDRNKRMKLDASPWNAEKIRRKLAKHSLWLVFALWTGFTFVGFFTPIRDLGLRVWPFDWGGWETFWVLFYALATWGNAGFLREQVCKYMCPYARFQGAMFDRNTLIISYDPLRGEPRGARRKGLGSVLERARGLLDLRAATAAVIAAGKRGSSVSAAVTTGIIVDQPHGDAPTAAEAPTVSSPEDLGDCIDCTICVQVCPTGIDIRNGLQYECIACGACVDACDTVMDKLGYPRGLVRYTTQNAVDGKSTRVLRPRVLIYGLLLSVIFAGWIVGVSLRTPLIVDVLRDRNALSRTAADGSIENGYTLKISNKQRGEQAFLVRIEDGGPVLLPQAPLRVTVAGEDTLNLPLTLRAPAGSVAGRQALRFVVESEADPSLRVEHETAFFGVLQ